MRGLPAVYREGAMGVARVGSVLGEGATPSDSAVPSASGVSVRKITDGILPGSAQII